MLFYNRTKLTNTITLNYNETIKRRLCYKNDDFVELAYEEKWYIGKIEDVDMTDQEVKAVCTERCWMIEGRFMLLKSVDKIRVENKGWEVTGEPNAMGDQRVFR